MDLASRFSQEFCAFCAKGFVINHSHSYPAKIDQPKLSTTFFESQASQSDGRRAVRTRVSCVSEASSLLERCFAWVIQGVHDLPWVSLSLAAVLGNIKTWTADG